MGPDVAWRVARSILVLFDQLEHEAPAAAPGASGGVRAEEWGTIGDTVHDPSSDHSPKNFPGWGSQIVTAGDFPNRPALGLDAHARLDAIRRSHDPRVKYGISNDQIFSSYSTANRAAWTWGPYNPNDPGRDRHRTHGHLSVVGDARADGTQPWQIGGAAAADTEDDMGQSFGPIQLEQGTTSLVIPPVQAGVADPRRVWLNVGGDLGNDKAAVRIWASDGAGNWNPVTGGGLDAQGIAQLINGEVLSVELAKGDRLISITRQPATGMTTVFARSLSACFERA